MGDWHISIQGTGCHHNGKASIDADMAASRFVDELLAQGHTVHSATFTHGGKMDIRTKCVVLVNGKRHEVAKDCFLSYPDVCRLAGMKGAPSVIYSHKAGKAEENGIMALSSVVRPKEGMRFEVCHTDNA